MTALEEFIRTECCTRACREAQTKRRRCRCFCAGRWHGAEQGEVMSIERVGDTGSLGGGGL